jgi:hypothetical protein
MSVNLSTQLRRRQRPLTNNMNHRFGEDRS